MKCLQHCLACSKSYGDNDSGRDRTTIVTLGVTPGLSDETIIAKHDLQREVVCVGLGMADCPHEC